MKFFASGLALLSLESLLPASDAGVPAGAGMPCASPAPRVSRLPSRRRPDSHPRSHLACESTSASR